ncbi:hypothetical protein D3C85_1793420 [compost metagenome]
MTIYATPFDPGTGQPTAGSTDSGFTTLDEVVEAMGSDYRSRGVRCVIYADLMFSDYVLRLEP